MCSTGLYIGLRKYWNFQSEAKLEQIIAIVTAHSVFLFFIEMDIFATLFRRCPTLWKLTLKTATLFRRCLTLFNSTLKYTTLLKFVNFNADVHNVVSTLIWRCATSRRHFNLKATLNRRWNVCWHGCMVLYI